MNENVIAVDDASFEAEVLGAELPVLVDVSARWCGPCKILKPIVDRLANENVGRFKVVEMDMDESPETAKRFGIRGVPTLLVFRDGQKVGAHLGVTSKEKLLALVDGGVSAGRDAPRASAR
jgi:thioredoxin 1